MDFNKYIVKQKLGFRFAGLEQRAETWRDPELDDEARRYYSLTYKPFKTTTIRGWFEDIHLDRVAARNTLVGDNVTPWIAAGRPIFDNGFATPRASPAANDPSRFRGDRAQVSV